MMAEPTLGARILDAANAYAAAISEQVVALDRGAWEVAHADAVTEAMDRLRALAARADAAERGMVALEGLVDELSANHKREMSSIHRRPYAGTGYAIELAQAIDALAAWRAINGGVV